MAVSQSTRVASWHLDRLLLKQLVLGARANASADSLKEKTLERR